MFVKGMLLLYLVSLSLMGSSCKKNRPIFSDDSDSQASHESSDASESDEPANRPDQDGLEPPDFQLTCSLSELTNPLQVDGKCHAFSRSSSFELVRVELKKNDQTVLPLQFSVKQLQGGALKGVEIRYILHRSILDQIAYADFHFKIDKKDFVVSNMEAVRLVQSSAVCEAALKPNGESILAWDVTKQYRGSGRELEILPYDNCGLQYFSVAVPRDNIIPVTVNCGVKQTTHGEWKLSASVSSNWESNCQVSCRNYEFSAPGCKKPPPHFTHELNKGTQDDICFLSEVEFTESEKIKCEAANRPGPQTTQNSRCVTSCIKLVSTATKKFHSERFRFSENDLVLGKWDECFLRFFQFDLAKYYKNPEKGNSFCSIEKVDGTYVGRGMAQDSYCEAICYRVSFVY